MCGRARCEQSALEVVHRALQWGVSSWSVGGDGAVCLRSSHGTQIHTLSRPFFEAVVVGMGSEMIAWGR
eukprot:5937984-Prymnesium_polylepis.1